MKTTFLAALIIAATGFTLAQTEPKPSEKKTILACLGKAIADYTSTFGVPKVNDWKAPVRTVHTYKTDLIDSLSVHQLPDYRVPVWIVVTFKVQPKTWQEALRLAGLPTEGITAHPTTANPNEGEIVLEGFKSVDGKSWAVSFDPTRKHLNSSPSDLEIQPKNLDDYKK